jgi:hypothetical protein
MTNPNEQSKTSMTVDEVIAALQEVKEKANLKGQTVVHICIQEIPYIPVVKIDYENDDDGSVILIFPQYEPSEG